MQTPLLERTNRSLRLTNAGRELIAHARRVLLLNSEVFGALSALRIQEAFRLGCSVHFADGLQSMLAELAIERPGLRFQIVTGLSTILADKLARGELDAAILLGTSTPRSEMLARLRLAWFGDAPAVRKAYPVAVVGGHSALTMRILETLARNDIRWQPAPWSADPVTIRASVQARLAYTALPSNAHLHYPSLPVTPADVLGPAPEPLPVYLAFSDSVSEAVVDAARMAARATLGDMPLVAP